MSIKEITVTKWKTSDGKVFDSPDEAAGHELEIPFEVFEEWYALNELDISDGNGYCHTVTVENMVWWLKEHIHVLKKSPLFFYNEKE